MPYGDELQRALQSARQSLKEILDEVPCEDKPAKPMSRYNREDLLRLCPLNWCQYHVLWFGVVLFFGSSVELVQVQQFVKLRRSAAPM